MSAADYCTACGRGDLRIRINGMPVDPLERLLAFTHKLLDHYGHDAALNAGADLADLHRAERLVAGRAGGTDG